MPNQHGGYRAPANPAAVSGPGAHSKRTDGKQPVVVAPGGDYGSGQELASLQSAAPLPQSGGAMPQGGAPAFDMSGITGLGAPSTQPQTPITDGAPTGAGAGPEALGMMDPYKADAQHYQKYLPAYVAMANDPNSPPGYVSWVRKIIANS